MRRPFFLIVLLLAVPAVAWAAFDDPEIADPMFFVSDTIPDQLQVDGDGRASFVSHEDVPVGDPDDGETDRQVVVYERCGAAWQVDSRHGLDDTAAFQTRPIALEVAANGDALVVWLDGDDDERTIYTGFRPAGGDWGAPQAVETLPVSHVLADIAPNGDAVLAYVEDMSVPGTVPLQVAVRTKASGTWAAQDLDEVEALWAVAMSPAADAIVLTADRTAQATTLDSWHKPAGGGWGARQEAAEVGTTNPLRTAIAFAPDGKAVLGVGVPSLFGILPPEVVTAVRGAGPSGTWSGLDERSEVDNSAGGIVAIDAVTHPGGVVLGWIERQGGAFASDLALARFNGAGFETPKVYDLDSQFTALSVGSAPSGKAIVAAQHETSGGRNRILVAEADGIAGTWPGSLEQVPVSDSGDHRDPRVAAGGITAVAYGVHAGNDSRSEVVASGPSPACGTATPTPTATASATPTATPTETPDPHPLPPAPAPAPGPTATDAAAPKGTLQKVAFMGGKIRLTLRLGEAAAVTFRVDGKRLAKRNLKAGTRKLALKPRKKLARGRHRLTAIAVDAAGNRSKPIAKRFRVR